jgi:hypothetical protein
MAGYVRLWHDSEALTGPAYVGYRAKTGKHLLVARFLSMALNRRANRADECPLLGHTGKLVLDLSFSGFDPRRTFK